MNMLGRGAYGVVHPAFDSKGNKVAIKRFDGKDKKKMVRITTNLERLLYLDHPNIVKILDTIPLDTVVWMSMELCSLGDLHRFFREHTLQQEQKIKLMIEIAKGVDYLYSENIIHRDIKPGNILISQGTPIHAKLTDFDLSKILDEGYDTSLMSSNVGTDRFKAPEFFLWNKERKIKYHRNVDIFASGLTFLAISQVDKENRKLVPRIETHRDNDDLFTPIGQIIATKMKLDVNELAVVKVEESHIISVEQSIRTEIKHLIQKMTRATPEERLSAAEVLFTLQRIEEQVIGDCHGVETKPDAFLGSQTLFTPGQHIQLSVIPPPLTKVASVGSSDSAGGKQPNQWKSQQKNPFHQALVLSQTSSERNSQTTTVTFRLGDKVHF